MQKKIIALAVAGLVSGGAFAQSSVTIFGLWDVSYVVNNAKGTTSGIDNSAIGSTHLGFKGVEDLGNGMKAFFALRENINPLTGGTGSGASGATTAGYNDFNAWAHVGLSGGFGTVTVGRQTVPVFATFGAVDALGAASLGLGQQWGSVQTLGVPNALTGAVWPLPSNTQGGARTPQAYAGGLGYATPNMGGFQGKLFTTLGNNITGASFGDNNLKEVGVSYNNMGISFNWAYDWTTNRVTANAAGAFPATITEMKTNVLGLAYTMGKVKISGSYYKVMYDASLKAVNHDNSAYSIGAIYNAAPWRMGAEFTAGKDNIDGRNKDNILGFLAGYSLSKRTELYGLLGIVNNSGNASLQPIWAAPTLVTAVGPVVSSLDARGTRNTSVVFGIRHAY